MKRTFERILFMIIGALIAFFAYMVGTTERGAEAQREVQGKVIECDRLITNEIIVSNKEGGVLIEASEKQIGISTVYRDSNNPKEVSNLIGMYVTKDKAYIQVGDTEDFVIMKSDKDGKSISLRQGTDTGNLTHASIAVMKGRAGIRIRDNNGSKNLFTD